MQQWRQLLAAHVLELICYQIGGKDSRNKFTEAQEEREEDRLLETVSAL